MRMSFGGNRDVSGHAGYREMMRTLGFELLAGLVLLTTVTRPVAGAESYPDHPIRMIVPYSPGGTGDTLSRLLAVRLKEILGQPLVIDNRPGAGGNIGAQAAATARPDGYTILMAATSLASNPSLLKDMGFDPLKDLTALSGCCEVPMIVVVTPARPITSIRDLVTYAKANPGKLTFSSSGIGTTSHLAGELFKVLAQVDMVHVPYKADAAALPDLLTGRIDLMFMLQTAALPQVKAGKLRPLAVTSVHRSPLVPELPTVAEAGIPGYEVSGWFGLFCPAGTPEAIVNRLAAAAVEAVRSPALKGPLIERGYMPVGSPSAQFSEFFKGEVQKWSRVVREGRLARID